MMRSHFRVVLAVSSMAAILFTATTLFASLDRGQIQGTATDPQGAVIPGVAVTVTNVATGVSAHLPTNSTGFYLATDLVPGTYLVHFENKPAGGLEFPARGSQGRSPADGDDLL